jgi:hypothetical protein
VFPIVKCTIEIDYDNPNGRVTLVADLTYVDMEVDEAEIANMMQMMDKLKKKGVKVVPAYDRRLPE